MINSIFPSHQNKWWCIFLYFYISPQSEQDQRQEERGVLSPVAAPDAALTSGMSGWQLNYCRNLFSLQIILSLLYAPSWEKSLGGEKVNVNNRFRLDSNLKQV